MAPAGGESLCRLHLVSIVAAQCFRDKAIVSSVIETVYSGEYAELYLYFAIGRIQACGLGSIERDNDD